MKKGSLLFVVVVLSVFSGPWAWGHGTDMDKSDKRCMSGHDDYTVHFDLDSQGSVFCRNLPAVGKATLIFDLVTPELRRMPVSIRLQTLEGAEPRTLLDVPPKIYEFGVAAAEFTFDKVGNYQVTLNVEEEGKHRKAHAHEPVITFPLTVGQQGGRIGGSLLNSLLVGDRLFILWVALFISFPFAVIGYRKFRQSRDEGRGMGDPQV